MRAFLNSSAVGQPLNWTGLLPPDITVGSVCALDRCLSVDRNGAKAAGGGTVYNDSKCESHCQALASYEWLANADFWSVPPGTKAGSHIYSTQATVLKKSTAQSHDLPSNMVLGVGANAPCILVSAQRFDNYWLCIHHVHGG